MSGTIASSRAIPPDCAPAPTEVAKWIAGRARKFVMTVIFEPNWHPALIDSGAAVVSEIVGGREVLALPITKDLGKLEESRFRAALRLRQKLSKSSALASWIKDELQEPPSFNYLRGNNARVPKGIDLPMVANLLKLFYDSQTVLNDLILPYANAEAVILSVRLLQLTKPYGQTDSEERMTMYIHNLENQFQFTRTIRDLRKSWVVVRKTLQECDHPVLKRPEVPLASLPQYFRDCSQAKTHDHDSRLKAFKMVFSSTITNAEGTWDEKESTNNGTCFQQQPIKSADDSSHRSGILPNNTHSLSSESSESCTSSSSASTSAKELEHLRNLTDENTRLNTKIAILEGLLRKLEGELLRADSEIQTLTAERGELLSIAATINGQVRGLEVRTVLGAFASAKGKLESFLIASTFRAALKWQPFCEAVVRLGFESIRLRLRSIAEMAGVGEAKTAAAGEGEPPSSSSSLYPPSSVASSRLKQFVVGYLQSNVDRIVQEVHNHQVAVIRRGELPSSASVFEELVSDVYSAFVALVRPLEGTADRWGVVPPSGWDGIVVESMHAVLKLAIQAALVEPALWVEFETRPEEGYDGEKWR
ncbi:hypothetical protein DFJ73DRAFT_899867 [Zopfochytrium polystomum]|nr:hypothetical protein DFJ73DRAFT_899867 [Zopfochytrium polystomum]